MRVAIVGASDSPDRFSFRAFQLLRQMGHEVVPVSPKLKTLEGVPVVDSVAQASGVDTVTMYVGPAISAGMTEALLQLAPRRVIFNPGSENSALARSLVAAGTEVVEDCTLVMLRAGTF